MLVKTDMVYQDRSVKWYAAITLAMPTAMFHVPNVRADRGVTADSGCAGAAVTIDATEGRRPSGGVTLSSSIVRVISVVFVFKPWEETGGA